MLYHITNVVDYNALEDLIFDGDQVPQTLAGVSGKNGYHPEIRSTTLKAVKPNNFPDICAAALKALSQYDPTVDVDEYQASEFNYLMYKEGDHFKKHQDVIRQDNPRVYTTVTLVKKTDDLIGGDLIIWDRLNNPHNITLNVGETVIFNSRSLHQVTPVERGTRESLVVWIYKKLPAVP